MLFRDSPFLGLRLSFFVFLSILIMVLDHRSYQTAQLRSVLSAAVAPLQYAVSWPVEVFDWINASVSKQQSLIEENADLRAQMLMLQAKMQKIMALQKENSQLRALLQSTAQRKENFTVASLLAVGTEPNSARVILDKGKNEGVYIGQAVLDANGVMGQVVEVGPITSQVMLITDVQSAVPVQLNRNGIRGIVVGNGPSRALALINVADISDIKTGDLLNTSGLGLHYPEGYPVGVISKIAQTPGQHFATIMVQPSARLLQSRQVLLVWQKGQQ